MGYGLGVSDAFQRNLRSRVFLLTACIFLCFLVLLLRLWYLQIAQTGDFSRAAEQNRLRKITTPDLRGKIFDRYGVELVSSRPSFDLVLIREDMQNVDKVLAELSDLMIELDAEKIKAGMKKAPAFKPFVAKRDMSRDEMARVEEHRLELPGVSVDIRHIRDYKYGNLGAHMLGYIGEISRKQLNQDMFAGYRQGDIVGKYGLEKSFESLLKGVKGKEIVEVNATGRVIRTVKQDVAKVGTDLFLSIDFAAQMEAENLMKGKTGSVVAIRPDTGEVIAMVSSPSFDLNKFAFGVSRKYWQQLLDDPFFPLNNRAIQGMYAPGSTYKIVMAAAALHEKVITPETIINCPGHFRLGRRTYRCWKRAGHGNMKLERAIAQSCDVYFYKVGLKLGVDTIAKWANRFGLGSITGISLDHEKSGLVPTKAWKLKNRGQKWIKGETVSTAIGQGFNLVTPIQMAKVVASIANGGYQITPTLLRMDKKVTDIKSIGGVALGITERELEIIRKGLYAVVNDRGTARLARIKGVTVAGKTGTSQVIRMKENKPEKMEDIPNKYRDHAWFVGYAPFEKPEVAVAVIVEHGGHGGSTAAPIAGKVMAAYLKSIEKHRKKPAEVAEAKQ